MLQVYQANKDQQALRVQQALACRALPGHQVQWVLVAGQQAPPVLRVPQEITELPVLMAIQGLQVPPALPDYRAMPG